MWLAITNQYNESSSPALSHFTGHLPTCVGLPSGEVMILGSVTCGEGSRIHGKRGVTNETGTMRHLAWPSTTFPFKAITRVCSISTSNNPNSHTGFILCSCCHIFTEWIPFTSQAINTQSCILESWWCYSD